MLHHLKIKHWVYLAAICFCFIPLVISFIISYRTTFLEVRSSAYRTNATYADLKKAYLNQYFEKIVSNADVLAKSDSISRNIQIMYDSTQYETVRDEAKTKLSRFLDSAEDKMEFEDVFITDKNGVVIYGDAFSLQEDLSDRTYIYKSLAGEQNWSKLFYSNYEKKNIIVLSTPVYTYADSVTPIATVNIVISQAILDAKVHEEINIIGNTGNAYLVDKDGLLWTDTMHGSFQDDSALKETINISVMSELSKAINIGDTTYEKASFYRGYDGKKVFGVCGVIQIGESNVGIIIEIDEAETMRSIIRLQLIYALFFILIIFLTLIVIRILVKNIKIPLLAIDEYTDKIVANQLEEELPSFLLARNDELGKIAKSINIIANHLIEHGKKLKYQAEHDFLTNIPNRRSFIQYLENKLQDAASCALILIDLDNFKETNDTLGHMYGDQMLVSFAKRLIELAEQNDNLFVSRYGGDEFLILIEGKTLEDDLRQQISLIDEKMRQLYKVNSDEIRIDFCEGISIYPEDAGNSNELLTYADIAMYKAKKSVSDTRMFFDHTMYDQLMRKYQIKQILIEAIENDGFELYYQPQLNLNTGKVRSFEALIRLKNHAIGPAEFIPVAEESQLITTIGRWITKKTIEQLVIWKKSGYDDVKISINFSIKQMEDKGYIAFLDDILFQNNIDRSSIGIEITESIFLENSSSQKIFLESLNNVGIELGLDDFGSGYSSLKYLTYFNLKEIKLDKEFNDYFIAQGLFETLKYIIGLFHSLELRVVAEGIEESKNCSLYKEMGCDYIQSYCVSRPIPAEKVQEWIDKEIEF